MKLFKSKDEKGQSLVEMAVAAPLLIFFLLGIFEVGAAVRNYLTLVNVNREITRFAVRPGYLDFSTDASAYDGYARIRDWTNNAASDQLNIDFTDTATETGSTTLIVSHLVVDTRKPCEDIYDNPGGCDCDAFVDDPGSITPYEADDLILHPGMAGQEYQTETFGPLETETGIKTTRLDYEAEVEKLTAQNNKFNCEIIKKGGIPSANNVIITELFIDQPQLFGFPFISNPYTDPVPLYTSTSMRLVGGIRNLAYNTTGHYCDAYPFIIYEETAKKMERDGTGDIFNGRADHPEAPGDGPGGDDFGWLTWNPDMGGGGPGGGGPASEQYLAENLLNSNYSVSDYTNARVPGDRDLTVGDWVASSKGVKAGVESSEGLLTRLFREGTVMRIPVWDEFDKGTGRDEVDAYHIKRFIMVKILNFDLPGKVVTAEYLGPDDGQCDGDPITGGAPTAKDDEYDVVRGSSKELTVVDDNDTDDDGPLEIVDVQWISEKGTFSYTSGGKTITYNAPDRGGGSAKLRYTIYDNHGHYASAEVTINITR